MVLWILFACLTAFVAAALLYPLSRRPADQQPDTAGEVEVYRDQMKELERDRAEGLIGAEEAEYARAEIGRRLLAAAGKGQAAGAASPRHDGARTAAIAAVAILPPALGLCLYIMLGNPGLPDQPLEARLADPGANMALLVAKAERHLAQNPNDGAGWDLLAPIYFRSGRLGDAELAYRNAIRILGANPARLSGLGETLVAANDGIVTEDARSAFEEAARREPGNPRARFYVGLALEQAGKTADARAAFEEIARASPPDAPWMGLINEHIAKNGGQAATAPGAAPSAPTAAPSGPAAAPGNPSAADVAAAEALSNDDRQAMIRGMVDSLAGRLKDDPNNIEGWLRLVQSYMVLGEPQKAAEALKTGLSHFPADGEGGERLVALAREAGLALEGAAPEGVKQ